MHRPVRSLANRCRKHLALGANRPTNWRPKPERFEYRREGQEKEASGCSRCRGNGARKINKHRASRHSGSSRRSCNCGRPKATNRPASAASRPLRNGLGEHRLRRVSQARHALVWKDETGQVHDGSGREKSRLPPRKRVIGLDTKNAGRDLVSRPASCFPKNYFSRRITSPWPTSWSFSHRRYL